MSEISAVWERIEAWYAAHGISDELNEGATPEQIAEFEEMYSVTFPEEIRESWLRHNGSYNWPHGALLSLDDMNFAWLTFSDTFGDGDDVDEEELDDGDEETDLWRHRMPFVSYHNVGCYLFDLTAEQGASRGKILSYYPETGFSEELSPSFEQYLSEIADDLETEGCLESGQVSGTRWD